MRSDQSVPARDLEMSELRWENRPVLLFAPSAAHEEFARQSEALNQASAGVEDREIVVIRVPGSDGSSIDDRPLTIDAVNRLLSQFDPSPDDFTFILVGKDGGEKLRSNEVVSIDRLFETIDAMPMRQREMQP